MIKRSIEAELLQKLEFFPAVGILGTRQVGKTTLAKTLPAVLNKEVIYLDLESPEDFQKLSYPEDYLKRHQNKTVIIDEIQILPNLLPVLRSLIDKSRNPSRFVLLGSVSPTLMQQSSESLACRISYVNLAGFNLSEVGTENMNRCWFRGGYPVAFLAEDKDHSNLWLDSFIENYVRRELPILGLNTSPLNIRRFWEMIGHSNGGLWNTSTFAKSLKLNTKTIDKYRDFLENAFLINVLQPYPHNIRKRLVKSPKVYIRDSGILHRLLRVSNLEDLYSLLQIGGSWEAFVVEQVRQLKQGDIDLFFFRTHNGAEVDLVFVKGPKILATAEVKLTNAPRTSKGLIEAIKTLKAQQNFIITPSAEHYITGHDLVVCSLPLFIKEYLPVLG